MLVLKGLFLSTVMLAFCLWPAPLPGFVSTCTAAPEGGQETIALPLDDKNVIFLERFIEFAGESLGFSILFHRSEVADHIFEFTSGLKIPRSKFQGFFERSLVTRGFLYVKNGDGPAAIHRVIRIPTGNTRQPLSTTSLAIIVDINEIDAYADRGILISVFVPLKYVESRQMITSLNPYFPNQGFESIRPIENSNGLLITTVANKAHSIVKLIRKTDIGNEPYHNISKVVKSLEQRIESLEKSLK